jgi:hypothetical protein
LRLCGHFDLFATIANYFPRLGRRPGGDVSKKEIFLEILKKDVTF